MDAPHELSTADILRQAGYGYRKTVDDDGLREIFHLATGRVLGACRAYDALTLALRDQVATSDAMLEALEAAEEKHQRGTLNMTAGEVSRVSDIRRAAIARVRP